MLEVRRTDARDADLLARLRLENQRESGEASDEPAYESALKEWFREHLSAGDVHAWIAVDDGRAVGTGGVVVVPRPPYPRNPAGLEAYVTNMYTVPDRRREGIGRRILDEITQHAKSLGVPRLLLHSSEAGRHLYEQAGFGERGRGVAMDRWLDADEP
jgi:GNAT superfamily N-acetyltransferase